MPSSESCRGAALLAFFLGLVSARATAQSHQGFRLEPTVMIPMRDGVRLAADLYFPTGSSRPWPVILIRTPYDKNRARPQSGTPNLGGPEQVGWLAAAGYAVAVEDVRGKNESEGRFRVQADDANDSYDTVEWLSHQPWSTGKIGTFGCSYLGETQLFLAKRHHPAHLAMIPQSAHAGPGRYLSIINGGAYELALLFGWMRSYGSKVHFQPAPGTPDSLVALARPYLKGRQELPTIDFQSVWRTLPLAAMGRQAGGPPTDWEDLVTHGPGDPWWREFNLLEPTDTIITPALHVGSWYDYGVNETLETFARFRKTGDLRTRDGQYVVISPASHCRSERATEHTIVGTRDVGDARFDYWDLYLRWMDHWLKGRPTGIESVPRVRYYLMGKNEWKSAADWPLPNAALTRFYLHSAGRANSRFGDGVLSVVPPKMEPSDQYSYDPRSPVPSVGGPLCCTGTPDAPEGAFDQTAVETRNDILVFTTPALENGIEVTGPLEAVLYVSSSAKDTDFTVKLVDVYPNGVGYNVQEGILRARYREGYSKQVWMDPGAVYEVRVNVHATSNYFGPGHRIRVEISSSNFPRFDRNLNTGGDNSRDTTMTVARNVLHHSTRYPSHVLLPVVP